jgi:hypothetical protein
MYRRPKFLEVLLEVRQQMARDADYDVDLFAEMIRSGKISEPHAENNGGRPESGPQIRAARSGRPSSE